MIKELLAVSISGGVLVAEDRPEDVQLVHFDSAAVIKVFHNNTPYKQYSLL